jgi:hypothetical protein
MLNKRSSGFHGGGRHYEHVSYPAALSDSDCDTVSNAIKSAWGI